MSGPAYVIFGKTVQPYQLAIATLSTVFGGIILSSLGSKPAPAAPPIQASSPEEEDFIGKYLKELEEKK